MGEQTGTQAGEQGQRGAGSGGLKGRVALVTGGSRGIGAAIAERLASEGADVALTYVASEEKAHAVVRRLQGYGVRARAFRADAARPEEVVAAVERTAAELGGLDVLVNNAGVAAFGPLEGFKLEDYDRTFDVNVRAVFVATQAAARHMKAGGRVVNIGSTNAERMPFPGGSVYAASKAAVAALTRGLARDLGARGITVNDVQPGPVDTDMNPAAGPFAETLKSFMAVPEYARAGEIAALVSYLVSADARLVTGANVRIDGAFAA